MALRPEVLDRLLLCKGLLGHVRFQPYAEVDRFSLAQSILTAHDAAELAAAAIAHQLDLLPARDKRYLMDYLAAIKQAHPDREVTSREYFSQLNRVRTNIKHAGLLPERDPWLRVGEVVYDRISDWCSEYLDTDLNALDETVLVSNDAAKSHLRLAVDAAASGDCKRALEEIGVALFSVIKSNPALRGIHVGISRAEDAIKLSALGVHASEYLALQEFLPRVGLNSSEEIVITWDQSKYGHPGNWRSESVEFARKAAVQMALRVQGARWIPGAISFDVLYEQKVTAARDGVEIWRYKVPGGIKPPLFAGLPSEREVVRVLNSGDSIKGRLFRRRESIGALLGVEKDSGPLEILSDEIPVGFCYVEEEGIRVSCVPRDHDVVKRYFADLPEIPWEG